MKAKYKKDCWVIGIIILSVVVVIWILISLDNSNDKALNFYKENCPKLNSQYLDGYSMCYRVVDNVLSYYNIEQINESYYLKENTQFFGVGRK